MDYPTTITYKELSDKLVLVSLGGKHVGSIKKVENGYQYYPKGYKGGGDIFLTFAACKISLEEDNNPETWLH